MSEQHPPPGTPEYLEYGAGSPLAPEPAQPATGPRRSRRAWWVGGGVVALLGVGAGAWAVMSFFQQGAQPAEALPATTVGYLSLDLDPSGGQKIDAFRTLNKFPAFKKDVGVDSVDQLREKIGDALVSGSGCAGVDFDRDIDPWLGNRLAAAVVPVGSDEDPQVVLVAQVTDDDKATAGIKKLGACAGGGQTGVVVANGWAIVAESQKTADAVSEAARSGSLADDPTYQKWTDAVGDAGVLNAYASPDAGRIAGKKLGELFDGGGMSPFGISGGDTEAYSSELSVQSSALHATADGTAPFSDALSGFHGGAATLRFTGDGLELAAAGDGSSAELKDFASATAGGLVSRLPADTGAAAGLSLSPGWVDRRLSGLSLAFGGGSKEDLYREMSQATGLDVPADIETLLGSGVAVSVSKDLDPEAVENSADGSDIPVAATVKGEPAKIEAVLDKIRARTGDTTFLGSDSSGDLEVVGPSESYRRSVLRGGDLGGDGTFRSVIASGSDAGSLIYVNVDAFEPALKKLASGGDADDIANLLPLRAVGLSSWIDNGVARVSLKVSTN